MSENPLKSKVAADTLAARLVLLRREMGWSQREASEATGVPFGVWQGMELLRETRGLDRHVVRIAAASGYDRDWLMWGGPLASPSHTQPDNDRYLRARARKAQLSAWVKRQHAEHGPHLPSVNAVSLG